MKQLTSYTRATGYLDKIFKLLNERYFENALSKPVITIQSTPKAYGHFTLYDAWHVNDEGLKEINIGAGTLDRPIENVVATLLHEMLHYFCYENKIQDVSRGGTYHNKRFREHAELRGLHISYDSRIGWSITEPTEELIDFIISNELSDILIGRDDIYSYTGIGGNKGINGTPPTNTPPKKSSTRKYICPSCGMSVRATKDVNILCMECNEQLIKVL